MAIQTITSRQNPLIVETAKLKDKKYRRKTGLFLIEGKKLFSEALSSGIRPERVFVTERAMACYGTLLNDADYPVFCVSDSVYEKISEENAPEGVLICAKHLDNLIFYNTIYKRGSQFPTIIEKENVSEADTEEDRHRPGEAILLCEALRDPGNLGTVIRTAAALGFDRLVLSADSADPYHPRTVRGAMGALFRQRTDITDNMPAYIASLQEAGYRVYAAALHTEAQVLGSFPVRKNTVFVVGNEGHGLSAETLAACDGTVIIPMCEGAESLNASVAASLLMWERSKAT